MNTNKLATLPTLPTNRTKASTKCACGCGRLTQRTFAPGHDRRMKGLMIRVARNVMTLEDVRDWGGIDTMEAVREAMEDGRLMKRWNIVDLRESDVEEAV